MREWEIEETRNVIDEAKQAQEVRALRKVSDEEKAKRLRELERLYEEHADNRGGRRTAERKFRKRYRHR